MNWIYSLVLAILLTAVLGVPAFAQTPPSAPTQPPVPAFNLSTPEGPEPPDIPERNGTYDVPSSPGLKVRVFVHGPRPQSTGREALPALSCNIGDPNSSSVTSPTPWHLPKGVWTYNLNPSSVPSSVGGSNLNTIVTPGFNQYSSATGGKVTFTRGADTTIRRANYDGRNIITWGKARSGTLGVTYIWYYPSTGLAVDVDTVMNDRYSWSWSGGSNSCAYPNTYDAQNILTHEEGHWLGLDDEYDSSLFGNNTMFGYGSLGEVKKNTLTTGDNSGMSAIYSSL